MKYSAKKTLRDNKIAKNIIEQNNINKYKVLYVPKVSYFLSKLIINNLLYKNLKVNSK